MDDDSLNFGSDAAGATPGSNSILAQPPLQRDTASPTVREGSSGQGATTNCTSSLSYSNLNILTNGSCRCRYGGE
jgi:hypothetical protein